MGQYYYIVNKTKRQYLHPHAFDDGLKLMEFGCSGQRTMLALALLLADGNGRGGGDLTIYSGSGVNRQFDKKRQAKLVDPIVGSWAGDQIVIAGDYADDGKFMSHKEIAECQALYLKENPVDVGIGDKGPKDTTERGFNLHCYAGFAFENISAKVLAVMSLDEGGKWNPCEANFKEDARESGENLPVFVLCSLVNRVSKKGPAYRAAFAKWFRAQPSRGANFGHWSPGVDNTAVFNAVDVEKVLKAISLQAKENDKYCKGAE